MTWDGAVSTALNRMPALAQFLAWADEAGLPLTAEVLWTEDRIEAFCATLNVPSVSTYRSFLRRIARANASRRAIWNASPETFERKPSRLVYTDEQVAEYLRLVDVQATERRRFVLASVLNLCLGFGLRTRELFTLAPTDVRERDGLVLCHLPDRVIPARAEHAGAIVELAASVETRFFLADHQRPSEDMGGLLENVDIPRYLPRPSVRALRNTWVVSLMSAGNLTLREVYVVAGLTSGKRHRHSPPPPAGARGDLPAPCRGGGSLMARRCSRGGGADRQRKRRTHNVDPVLAAQSRREGKLRASRRASPFEPVVRRAVAEAKLMRQGERLAFKNHVCQEAADAVDRSRVAELCEERLTSAVGRPRHVPFRAMLCLVTLLSLTAKGMLVVEELARVAYGLTPAQRRMFGLTRFQSHTIRSTYEKTKEGLESVVDLETGEILDPALGIEVDEMMTRLAQAGIPDHVHDTSTKALDSTDTEVQYRIQACRPDKRPADDGSDPVPATLGGPREEWLKVGPDGRYQYTHDPDARAGHRTATRNQNPNYIGYELHLVVDVPEMGGDPAPQFIRAVTMPGSGTNRVKPGLDAVDLLQRPPQTLLVDRGYPYLKGWGRGLRDRGIDQYFDLRDEQRSVRPGPVTGTIWVDGQLYTIAPPREAASPARPATGHDP